MTDQGTKGNIVTDGITSDLSTLKNDVNKKFGEVTILMFTVVIILLVMVATLVIDSFHFNSATYRESSEKTQYLNSLQDTNKTLLEQNKKNQDLIREQQGQILKLLNTK